VCQLEPVVQPPTTWQWLTESRLKKILLWTFLLGSPVLVYYRVLFDKRTIGRHVFATDSRVAENYAAVSWPVTDDVASAYQDEMWLQFIRASLLSGELPIINLQNALGAPFLESLQPGAMYVLNPVLLLFNPTRPKTFDYFCLLHVYILLIGLFRLFRLHARDEIAAAIAILIAFGGVTYANINLVHYRGFVWLPWMMGFATQIAHGDLRRRNRFFLFAALLCGITAGNIQDFAFSFPVTLLTFLTEFAATKREAGWKAAFVFS